MLQDASLNDFAVFHLHVSDQTDFLFPFIRTFGTFKLRLDTTLPF
jgi:hypothetical protein